MGAVSGAVLDYIIHIPFTAFLEDARRICKHALRRLHNYSVFVGSFYFFVDLKHFFFGDALRMDFLRSGCRTDRRFGGTVQREKQRRSKRYEQSCGSLKKYSFCNGGKYKAAIWSHRNTVKFSSHNKNSYGGFLGGL